MSYEDAHFYRDAADAARAAGYPAAASTCDGLAEELSVDRLRAKVEVLTWRARLFEPLPARRRWWGGRR